MTTSRCVACREVGHTAVRCNTAAALALFCARADALRAEIASSFPKSRRSMTALRAAARIAERRADDIARRIADAARWPFVHLFFDPSIRFRSLAPGIPSCRLCGCVKRGDGRITRCRGLVRMVLRDAAEPQEPAMRTDCPNFDLADPEAPHRREDPPCPNCGDPMPPDGIAIIEHRGKDVTVCAGCAADIERSEHEEAARERRNAWPSD